MFPPLFFWSKTVFGRRSDLPAVRSNVGTMKRLPVSTAEVSPAALRALASGTVSPLHGTYISSSIGAIWHRLWLALEFKIQFFATSH